MKASVMTPLLTAALLLLSLGLPCFAQAPGRQYANLVYPARGNIHLDEGTLELWLVSDFDADAKGHAAMPFDLRFPDDGSHFILMLVARNLAFIGYTRPQQSYTWSERLTWKPGEPHHVAVTWSGRKRSVYVDGRVGKGVAGAPLQGEGRVDTSENVVVEGWIRGDLTAAQIWAGLSGSSITLDELRLSSVARPLEEIVRQMGSAPAADLHTLLLDHCDGGPAEVISGDSGETGGKLQGKFRIVDTKHGKGIALWSE